MEAKVLVLKGTIFAPPLGQWFNLFFSAGASADADRDTPVFCSA